MKWELQQIPHDKKWALMEAQMKCSTEEFSDDQLKQFLQCEGMNAKVHLEVCMMLAIISFASLKMLTYFEFFFLDPKSWGAQHFVNYWEGRREVFGPEKFMLPMTLSEALCDDLVALEPCVLRLLPVLDASGRQLLFCNPCCHTRKGTHQIAW